MFDANKKKKTFAGNGGFTLIEMIVYVALVGIIAVVIFKIIFLVSQVNNKIMALSRINANAYSAMNRMIYEIENSEHIYLPTSNFKNYYYDAAKGEQLSLETEISPVPPDDTAYVDFYLEGDTLFLKKEGSYPVALTSSNVSVSNLNFYYYRNGWRESVTVDLTVKFNSSLISDSKIHLISATALRSPGD